MCLWFVVNLSIKYPAVKMQKRQHTIYIVHDFLENTGIVLQIYIYLTACCGMVLTNLPTCTIADTLH